MDLGELRWVAWVALGGGLGSVARYGITGWLTRGPFPWGTFVVNFTGTFLLVLIYGLSMGRGFLSTEWRSFLFIGVFGGFTTFSTFGLETVNLLHSGQTALAMANIALNGGVCLGGAVAAAALAVMIGGA